MTPEQRIEELEADARYHRERHDLYRAKSYGERLTSPARLRELALASQAADARLRQARRTEPAGGAPAKSP